VSLANITIGIATEVNNPKLNYRAAGDLIEWKIENPGLVLEHFETIGLWPGLAYVSLLKWGIVR
jgi:hypothetical protein